MVRLGDVTLGQGRIKVAASLCASTAVTLRSEAQRLAASDADVAEWRLDYLLAARREPLDTFDAELPALLAGLRQTLGTIPLVVTLRSRTEGGQLQLSDTDYHRVLQAVLATGHADAVDVEFSRGPVLTEIGHVARQVGWPLIVSRHDIAGTPPVGEIVAGLREMVDAGGQVAKFAVTAHEPSDVLTLLAATLEAHRSLSQPIITMAMGDIGLPSRLCGQVFGSAMTFGALHTPSASGQVDVAELRHIVDLHPVKEG